MLAANNLPAGWSLTSTTESTSSEPQCLINAQAGLKGTSNAEATFVYGSGGLPVLGEYLAYLPGQGQSALTSASQTLAGCGQISTSSAGQTLSGTLGSMPFTAVADQSSAYQASLTGTVSGQSVTLGIDVVVFRKSDTVAMIFYANLGTPDATALQQIVQSAAAKLS